LRIPLSALFLRVVRALTECRNFTVACGSATERPQRLSFIVDTFRNTAARFRAAPDGARNFAASTCPLA